MWISVDKQLPETDQEVLAYWEASSMPWWRVAFYDKAHGGWHTNDDYCERLPLVTHWQRLTVPTLKGDY